jgi:uncharacterized protein YxeA
MESNAGLTSSDFADRTHPNNSGYRKMSKVWFNKLKTLLPPPIPDAPERIVISSVTSDSAVLSWNDTSSNEAGFKIYRGNKLIASLSANTTSYTLSNLDSRTSYSYTVKSYNEAGESTAKLISFTTEDDYAWLVAVNYILL